MQATAKGRFEIKMAQEPLSEVARDSGFGRMSLSKQYFGDIEGQGTGEMLGYRSQAAGSGGYVAMETVQGTLAGRRGSFVLQHSSIMTDGIPAQSIQVVPGSGTGKLAGLSGALVIVAVEGQHTYEFSYSMPETA